MAQKTYELSPTTFNGRQILRMSTELCWADRLGSWKARWGIGRMKYLVGPGIYAVGSPDSNSPVFVSANYKMSFDRLRSQLSSRDAWILVLDTRGINVWCAAGKGTFGTKEIVKRIEAEKLNEIVTHRKLIVPQLGATGLSAHKVKQQSGFHVIYGPVRTEDLPAFLDAGMKATDKMRRVYFPLWNRMVLIPMEIVMWSKYALLAAVCFFLLGGLNQKGYSITLAMTDGLRSALLLLASFLAAAILGPILLPWLPGRAFSTKGMWVGLTMSVGTGFYSWAHSDILGGRLNTVAWLMIIPVVTSFIVMNFTGASTYTSLSGVKQEMRIAVPLQLLCAIAGIGLWLWGRFV